MPQNDRSMQLSFLSRRRIIKKLMDTFQKHLRLTNSESIKKLSWILQRFEAKVFKIAKNKEQYIQYISQKIMLLEALSEELLLTARNGNGWNYLTEGNLLLQRNHKELRKFIPSLRLYARL
ncbi:hypothetical protein O6H91_23G054000 [Diphasiastrum complanatum]|uniref:Uncharacterized protein n=1 Tax=Diphasiastrum complanatum TaxID=34168 RepID=A0ACC2AAQ0_DIPCM|nr:hypothetical protein O6H91_Y246100 [Diphasiastrum complanatum]KAJ7514654.1 hypothetical protein O6H91_23G054000 [Diphasiastrum complanatum]